VLFLLFLANLLFYAAGHPAGTSASLARLNRVGAVGNFIGSKVPARCRSHEIENKSQRSHRYQFTRMPPVPALLEVWAEYSPVKLAKIAMFLVT